MAIKFAVTTRNARADAVETDLGASPVLEIRTGAPPADCAAADSGTLLASLALPADAFAAASAGAKAKQGTWEDASANASGQAGHFRVKTSGGVCKMQGTAGLAGASPDLVLDNDDFESGQAFSIPTFGWTEPHA